MSEHGLAFQGESSGEPYEFMHAGQRDRLGLHLAARRACRLRVRGRGHRRRKFRKPGAAGAVELEWPKTLIVFPPARDRRPAGRLGQHRRARPEDQAGDRDATSRNAGMQVAQIGYQARRRSRARSRTPRCTSRPSRSRPPAEAHGARARRCSTSSPTATSPPRASRSATRKIKAGTMVQVKGVGQNVQRHATASRPRTHVLRGGGSYKTTFANSPATRSSARSATAAAPRADFGAQLVARHRHQQQRPRGPGPRPREYPALGERRPRAPGRASPRRAPARSAAC